MADEKEVKPRPELLERLETLVAEMGDDALESLIDRLDQGENPPVLLEASKAPSGVLYEVTLVTAALDDHYFQGFLNGGDIKHKIVNKMEGSDSLVVKYVASKEKLEHLVRDNFKSQVAGAERDFLNKIQPYKG